MKVLITGAAGFLGRRVIEALLSGAAGMPQVSRIVAADAVASPLADSRIDARVGTILEPDFIRSIVPPDVAVVFHLAAVLSGQAEAGFDTGLRVNADGTRTLLAGVPGLGRAPRARASTTLAVLAGGL